MKQLKIYIALLSVALISSCKPQDAGTGLSSIDNLAAKSGSYHLNSCTGSSKAVKNNFALASQHVVFDSSVAASKKASIVADLQSVIKIVPSDMVNGFFAKGNKIYISGGSPKVCKALSGEDALKQAGKEQTDSQPFACWFADPVSKTSGVAIGSGTFDGNPITVNQAIKHSLLRSIVSYFSFVIMPNADSDLGQASNSTEALRQVDQIKEVLAESLLNDASQNGVSDMGAISRMSQATLGHYALIESIDSALCSARTLEVFQTCFPNSFATFSTMSSSALEVDSSSCQAAVK